MKIAIARTLFIGLLNSLLLSQNHKVVAHDKKYDYKAILTPNCFLY